MIATAVMWYSFARIVEAEAEHGEILDEDDVWPLYFTFGPLLLDAWAFWCLAMGVGGV